MWKDGWENLLASEAQFIWRKPVLGRLSPSQLSQLFKSKFKIMKKSCLLCQSQQLTCMLCMWSTCTCLKQRSHMLWLSNLDRVDSTEWAKVFIWRKVGPARRVTQSPKKGDPARQVTLLADPTFCFSCNKMPCFERKCMKSWLAQGSSGRWMTLSCQVGQLFSI